MITIRNILIRNLDFKSFCVKFVLRPRKQRLSVQCVKCLCIDNSLNAHHTQIFGRNYFPITTGIQSWKWFLAIALVYAGYDSQSEF